MSFWKRLFGGGAEEAKAVDFSPDLMAAIAGGWGLPTKSGQQVSVLSAQRVTAFHRGVVVLAEGVAQLPIEIHKRSRRGTEPATDHPVYDLLLNRANNLQDAFQFWRTMLMHAVATGDGVAYKVMVNGQLKELVPTRPEATQIRPPDQFNRVEYHLGFESGYAATVGSEDVFHIKGPSWAAHRGLDPTIVGREAIGLAQSTEETHARLHANGARPSGLLTTTQKLTKEQIASLREQWSALYGGASNTGKTPVLTGGIDWRQVAQKGVDAEHLDTRKHQVEEIARLLGIFPIMLGHAGDQSPTFASAAAFLEAHVRYSLQPWFKAVRSAVETQILTPEERAAGYYCRIDTSELLRGSLVERTNYYKTALGTNSNPGWMTPNEVREDDGWNPAENPAMDEVWQPQTMAPVGRPGAAPAGQETKATPRTLYVYRKLLNGRDLIDWAKAQGFTAIQPAGDLHVTVAYSRKPIDWMAVPENWFQNEDGGLVVKPGGPRVVEALGRDGAVALLFASNELAWRHRDIIEAGASWDFPEYQPHVTITWAAGDLDLEKVVPFKGELRFGPEIFEEVDPTWKDRAMRRQQET